MNPDLNKGKAPREQLEGTKAVPLHHRLKLGQNVIKDPQGAGAPSSDNKIPNNQKKSW